MKKTYIQPSIEAVKIQHAVLAPMSDPQTKAKFDPSTSTPITDPNKMDSFGGDWGEIED
jgi:hypothetical protein